MATTLGAHLSPLELDSRIMSIGAEASLAKIYALEAVIDANLEADYLYAEYTVLREGGDMDDLELLYLEAEQAATQKKEGLISQLINWITTNLSRFFGWLSDLFGKKMENINPKERKKVNKYEMGRTREIISNWDKFRGGIENIINGIKENNAAKAAISVTTILGSAGLGFLARGKLEEDRKENDKGETTTVSGEEIIETVSKLGTIKKKLEEWIKEFNDFRSEFVDKVNAEAEKIQKNKDEKKAEKAAGGNNSKTEETTESTITAADLFGSYVREADENKDKKDQPGNNRTNTGANTGKPAGAGSNDGKKNDQGQNNPSDTSTGGTNSQAGSNNKPVQNGSTGEGKTDQGKSETSDDGKKNDQSSGEEQKTEDNKPSEGSTDGDKKEPSKVTKVQAAIKVSLQAITDLLKGLLEFAKNVFAKFRNGESEEEGSNQLGENPENNEPKNDNNENGEGAQENQEKTGDQGGQPENASAPLDYTQGDYVSESRRINLFGIDESDFDYLTEMSDDDKADIDFLLENL